MMINFDDIDYEEEYTSYKDFKYDKRFIPSNNHSYFFKINVNSEKFNREFISENFNKDISFLLIDHLRDMKNYYIYICISRNGYGWMPNYYKTNGEEIDAYFYFTGKRNYNYKYIGYID